MIDEINSIFSEWDPINVGYPLSLSEYQTYAGSVRSCPKDRAQIKACLMKCLATMGLDYNPCDPVQAMEIDRIVEQIFNLKK